MKNLKKVLALVLACVMVFGTVAMAGSVYPDVADDAIYAESVKALSALGIIKGDENGNFNPDATITRAEMAKILCTMLGTGDIAPANTIFSDVPSSHWASGYVNYAQQYGCIAGYGDGTFGPEDPVTYEQVIKLIMAALGYTPMAEENGGYPTGYLYVAADMEVTERAVGNGPEPAPRGTVAILVCNAMNTPVMERVSYGTEAVWDILDGGSYNGIYGVQSREFKTLLTSKHKVYKVAGKVVDSYKGEASLKDGIVNTEIWDRMKIGVDKLLGATGQNMQPNGEYQYYELNNINAEGTDAAEYVGYESYLYFKVSLTGDINLICVTPKSARNKSIVIEDVANVYDSSIDTVRDADKIQLVTASPSPAPVKYVFSYWNDRETENRITAVDLDLGVKIYKNNKKVTSIDNTSGDTIKASIVPASGKGSITLVDTDNDGDYDLIKTTEIITAVVNTINAKANAIYLKQDGKSSALIYNNLTNFKLNADSSPDLREYKITIDGAEADVADLKEYDVLSIVTNDYANPIFVYIDVTRNVIEGKVTAKRDVLGTVNDYVVIGGEKYKAAAVTNITTAGINIDEEGKFYLNADGEIVLKDTTSVLGGDYAYLYSTGDGNFAGETYVRMFTKDGADVTYKVADKIKINGVQAENATTAFTTDQLIKMFRNNTFVPSTAPAAVVSDLFAAPTPIPTATGTPIPVVANSAVPTSANLTASTLIKCLVDGYNDVDRTAYELIPYTTSPSPAGYGAAGLNRDIAKFVKYKVNSNGEITELNIAAHWATADGQFGYEGFDSDVQWKESLAKFDGGEAIPDNAVVFFVPAVGSIADYSVKTVADLVDGTTYTPYYFTKTEDGPAAVLMFGSRASMDTKSPFAIFAGASSIKVDGDDAYSVTYWKDGAKVEETLTVVDGEYGALAKVAAMNIGDAFIYSMNDNGQADDIHVIFSAGTAPVYNAASPSATPVITHVPTLRAYISTPAGSPAPFQFYGDANNTADNELIFGIVAKTKSIEGGVRLTLANADGDVTTAETINVPNTAKVVYYNAAANDARKLAEAAVTDIIESPIAYKLANGNYDYADPDFVSQIQHLNYAFIRVYKDVVTEVIFVRYASDL